MKRTIKTDYPRISAKLFAFCLALSLFPGLTGFAAHAAKEREVPREDFLAGDAIRIVIPADTGSVLKGIYPIDGTGMADLPITGRVVIAGKNRQNIEQYLAGIWAPYLKDTHVQAIPVIRVAIMGNVKTPGYYYPSPDAVIYDAINLAGGPLLPFKLEKTSHLRAGKNINDELARNISQGMTLREAGIVSGDEILIPVPERITMKEAIPLVGTALAIVLNAMTIYFLTADRSRN
ncbi:MAG: Polysaccharide biosynthesis/export protein [Fibrobacteres bacterium]|nr:Polysaccharide biosynthesis/export protein [Fibrobacterota bacterium]